MTTAANADRPVLVAGASGFVGSPVTKLLVERAWVTKITSPLLSGSTGPRR